MTIYSILKCKFKQIFFCCSVTFIEYSFNAINVLSSKPSVGLYQEIEYLICADKPVSPSNIITFLLSPQPSANKKLPCALNPMPKPEYLHLSGSVFLVNLTA